MEIRFVFVLLSVEINALIFSIFHLTQNKLDLYNAYNSIPITYNTSTQLYTCFSSVKHCIFEDHQHISFKITHLVFIIITISCYISLLCIMKQKWEEIQMNRDTGITWYSMLEFLVEICLVSNTILLIVLFYLEQLSISQCYIASRLVRYENLISYIILNIIEGVYIGSDILKRQAQRQKQFDALQQRITLLSAGVVEINANDGISLINYDNTQHTGHSLNYGSISRDVTNENTADT